MGSSWCIALTDKASCFHVLGRLRWNVAQSMRGCHGVNCPHKILENKGSETDCLLHTRNCIAVAPTSAIRSGTHYPRNKWLLRIGPFRPQKFKNWRKFHAGTTSAASELWARLPSVMEEFQYALTELRHTEVFDTVSVPQSRSTWVNSILMLKYFSTRSIERTPGFICVFGKRPSFFRFLSMHSGSVS